LKFSQENDMENKRDARVQALLDEWYAFYPAYADEDEDYMELAARAALQLMDAQSTARESVQDPEPEQQKPVSLWKRILGL
jgi:hypothetical protein